MCVISGDIAKERFGLIYLLLGIKKKIGYPSPIFYYPFSFVYEPVLDPNNKSDLVDYALAPILQSLNITSKIKIWEM